jgi:prepilin-type N-terminal cleavage/methylation domain-containing protein
MKLKSTRGFTLIEIMVVTTVSMVMVGMGLTQYNQFKQKQGLLRATNKFVTDLREVQQRADVGKREKCVGVETISLEKYTVEYLDSSSASINEHCTIPSAPPSQHKVGSINLPDEVKFVTNSFSISFPVLSQNATGVNSIILKNTNSNYCTEVNVNNGRDISMSEIPCS